MATRAQFDSEQRVVNLTGVLAKLNEQLRGRTTEYKASAQLINVLNGRIAQTSNPFMVKKYRIAIEAERQKMAVVGPIIEKLLAEIKFSEVTLATWWSTYEETGKLPPLITSESPTGVKFTLGTGDGSAGDGLGGLGTGITILGGPGQLPSEEEEAKKKKQGKNIGWAVGGFIFLILVVTAIVIFGKRKKK